MKTLHAILTFLGFYAASIVITLIGLFLTIGATSGWGAARTGDAMVLMLTGIAVLYFISTVAVFFVEGYFIPNIAARILTALGYGGLSFVTLLLLAFMSAIIFNR